MLAMALINQGHLARMIDPEAQTKTIQHAADEANKAVMKENTDSALARGAFGSPTFFVGDEMFFGHDRLDYALAAVTA